MSGEWFISWFDSPYYHLLYADRDQDEAQQLISAIVRKLKPVAHSKVLDVGCGRGRHSVELHSLGFQVCGIDLSHSNITYAKSLEKSGLSFQTHDMRSVFKARSYDWVMNLFTSFGYLRNPDDHLDALINMSANLKEGGQILIDYFNCEPLLRHFRPQHDIQKVENVTFDIRKRIDGSRIIKEIHVMDGDRPLSFREEVQLFTLSDFQHMFDQAGLDMKSTFGDYNLNSFQPESSDRLIMWGVKR